MKEITAALVRAQQNFLRVEFDKGGHNNRYASYASIRNSTHRFLLAEGINVEFSPWFCAVTNRDMLKMTLKHISGEFIDASQPMFLDANAAIKEPNQRYGSATTYAMRNLARMLLALDPDDNDLDKYDHSKDTPKIDDQILELMNKHGISESQFLSKAYKKTRVEELTDEEADEVIALLKAKK